MKSAEDRARSFLSAAVSEHRVPSSLLIYGPKGCGRFETALHLVKEVNGGDEERTKAIEEERDADLLIVSPDGASVKVQQIRETLKDAYKNPLLGPKRFLIVREADKLTYKASQALLKAAEDTPDETCLILLTSNPHQLPKTLESRLISLAVRQSRADIKKEIEAGDEKTKMAARMGEGSLGRAKSYLDEEEFVGDTLRSVRKTAVDLLWGSILQPSSSYLSIIRGLDDEMVEPVFSAYLSLLLDLVLYLNESDWLRNPDLGQLYERLSEEVETPELDFLRGLLDYQRRMKWNVASKRQLGGLVTYVWRWKNGL